MPEFSEADLERWADAMARLGVIKLVLPGGVEISMGPKLAATHAPARKLTAEEQARADAEHRERLLYWSATK